MPVLTIPREVSRAVAGLQNAVGNLVDSTITSDSYQITVSILRGRSGQFNTMPFAFGKLIIKGRPDFSDSFELQAIYGGWNWLLQPDSR